MCQNVLFIMVDQMHADCLSIAGHSYVKTPNLDKLSQSGVRFTQCYVQSPICLPSRISYLSGQYLKTHHQYGFVGKQHDDMPNLMRHLRQHGYQTAAVGKQHIGTIRGDWGMDYCAPSLWEDQAHTMPKGLWYGDYLSKQGMSFPTEEAHGAECLAMPEGDEVSPHMHPMRRGAGKSRVPVEHGLEHWTTDRCLDFLNQHWNRNKPFCMWLSYDRPHFPNAIPTPWYERLKSQDVLLDELLTAEQLAAMPAWVIEQYLASPSRITMPDDDMRHLLATYFTIIEMIDQELGRLFEWLTNKGVMEQTHIIFCADHGDNAGDLGIYDKKLGVCSNAIIRVPLIWRPAEGVMADSVPGTVVDSPVEAIDLFSTVCDLCELPVPDAVQGVSLASVFAGDTLPMDRPVFSEQRWRRAVVYQGWKYIHHVDQPHGELYELANDPLCRNNRFDDPACQMQLSRLKHLMIRFLANPYTQLDVQTNAKIRKRPELINKWRTNKWWVGDAADDEHYPNFIDGGSTWLIQQRSIQVFYDLHAEDHWLVDMKSDSCKTNNLMGLPSNRNIFTQLQAALLNELCRKIAAIDYLDAPASKPYRLSSKQVHDAVISHSSTQCRCMD